MFFFLPVSDIGIVVRVCMCVCMCVCVCVNVCAHICVWRLPLGSPRPYSPAAAGACRSSGPQCTRRTSCSRRPAGRAWPSADPGPGSRRRCRWRTPGWLGGV